MSGFLGWSVCRQAREDWQVCGTYNSHRVDLDGVQGVRVELTDRSALEQLFTAFRPDAVIHAAAASQPNFCQLHPHAAHRINVEASLAIAELTGRAAVPCAFTSTDLVFDGRTPPYSEESAVNPINVYGEQKVAAERGMRERNNRTIVCRMPLMFGDPSPASQSFLQPILGALRHDREISLFVDEHRTPSSSASAARGLLLSLEECSGGILHMGGPERISRFWFGRRLAAFLGLDESLVQPASQRDVQMPAPRPADVSLESSSAATLGYSPRTVQEEFELLECLQTRR
jgi:dTDP-4-dehydrorhamnose reductase